MSTTDEGRVGEAKVFAELAKLGWYPFIDPSGKCPVDLVAWKDGKIRTFQVKSTRTTSASGRYIVQIGSTRPNRTGNVIKKFDNTSVDYLAVYVSPTDMVYFVKASLVTTGRTLTIQSSHEGAIPE